MFVHEPKEMGFAVDYVAKAFTQNVGAQHEKFGQDCKSTSLRAGSRGKPTIELMFETNCSIFYSLLMTPQLSRSPTSSSTSPVIYASGLSSAEKA